MPLGVGRNVGLRDFARFWFFCPRGHSCFKKTCLVHWCTCILQVCGIDQLWSFALRANNTDVSITAIQILNSYYINFGSGQLEKEEEFVQRCMENLASSLTGIDKVHICHIVTGQQVITLTNLEIKWVYCKLSFIHDHLIFMKFAWTILLHVWNVVNMSFTCTLHMEISWIYRSLVTIKCCEPDRKSKMPQTKDNL